MKTSRFLTPAALLLAAALNTGCVALAPARLALPEPLAAAPALPFEGLGGGRQGRFSIDGHLVAFERNADRVSLFGVLGSDKTMLSYRIDGAAPASVRCDGRALQGTLGVIDAPLRPFTLQCRIEGSVAGQLEIAERRGAAGTLARREGRLQAGGVTLEVRSLHELQGSAFQMAQPAGYTLHHEGRVVAALDLSDRTPLLRRTGAAPAVQHAVLLAAVTLGLLWDPAASTP